MFFIAFYCELILIMLRHEYNKFITISGHVRLCYHFQRKQQEQGDAYEYAEYARGALYAEYAEYARGAVYAAATGAEYAATSGYTSRGFAEAKARRAAKITWNCIIFFSKTLKYLRVTSYEQSRKISFHCKKYIMLANGKKKYLNN